MDKSIYEERAKGLDDVLTTLIQELESTGLDDEGRNGLIHDIKTLSGIEAENAKILLESERTELRERELTHEECVTNEKHEVDTVSNELRKRELDIRESENSARREIEDLNAGLKTRELDIREVENRTHKEELAAKVANDKAKLEIEESAVKARVIGEGLKVASTVIGCVGTIVALKSAMTFEKMDDGGILPSKFINTIFKMMKS